MIIYNVTVKVTPAIEEAWVAWMREEHMLDLMNTGLFLKTQLCQLLDVEDEEGATYVAQYFCESRAEYEAYIQTYAQEMREKGLSRFGDQFIAFRTLMEVIG
jgi:hypothetical protein